MGYKERRIHKLIDNVMHKQCRGCDEWKPLTCFGKRNQTWDGLLYKCRECGQQDCRKWRSENKEITSNYNKKWYIENSDRRKEYNRIWWDENSGYRYEYNEKNKEHIKLVRREYRIKNKGRYSAHAAKRRARKLQATPDWLSESQIKEIELIYEKCEKISVETGVKHHVDHIIPLQGKIVCGLHVPWNLRIIEATENLRKSNKYIIEVEDE